MKKLTPWMKRSFDFLRAYEALCKEHGLIISNNRIKDMGENWSENPYWYIYFEGLDRDATYGSPPYTSTMRDK